jgi:hypothetical protein
MKNCILFQIQNFSVHTGEYEVFLSLFLCCKLDRIMVLSDLRESVVKFLKLDFFHKSVSALSLTTVRISYRFFQKLTSQY